MNEVFQAVLNMSITGAFVIAAVILVRLPLKKAPKIISYCLWAVVGFRLICPFSIESVLSLIPFEPEPVQSAWVGTTYTYEEYMRAPEGTINERDVKYYDVPPETSVVELGAYIWPVGVAIMLIYGVVSYILLKRKMRGATHVGGNIYEAENIRSPFVLGIFKPKIYLPCGLSEQEREYILLHEQTHIRRFDHIIKFAAYFILCLHWFNPLVWAAFLLMGVDMEMSCDERVLKKLGLDTKKDYSLSLLSMATERRVIGGSPLAFSEGGLKERIKNIMKFKKHSRVIIIAAIALVVILSVGFAVNRTSGTLPFQDLKVDEINSISLFCRPPDVTIEINDRATIEKIASTLQTVVTYEQDDSGRENNGQLVQYTLTMLSGESIEVGAYNPFIFINGQCYRTKYEPCEELNSLGNQLTGDKKSPYQEALAVVNAHYPEASEIVALGSETISYTNPPAPVEVYSFEVVVSGKKIKCAVSKEKYIFFTYSDSTWWVFTGARGMADHESGESGILQNPEIEAPADLADIQLLADSFVDALKDGRDLTGDEGAMDSWQDWLVRRGLTLSAAGTPRQVENAPDTYDFEVIAATAEGSEDAITVRISLQGGEPRFICPYTQYFPRVRTVAEHYFSLITKGDIQELAGWLSVDGDRQNPGSYFIEQAEMAIAEYGRYDLSTAKIDDIIFYSHAEQLFQCTVRVTGNKFPLRLTFGDGLLMPERLQPRVVLSLETYNSGGLSFILHNETDKEYTYGEYYALFVLKNSVWHPVEPIIENGAFNSIGYMLQPRSTTGEITVNWRWLYGELPDGYYRFQKIYTFNRSFGDYDSFVVEQSFSISE